MEDSRIESMTFLRPHRRSPLKRQTNQVLAQILSLYGDQSHSGRLVKFFPYQHSPDTLSLDENIFTSPEQINEKGGSDHGELNRSNAVEPPESSSPVAEKVIKRTNIEIGVSISEMEVLDVTKSESLKVVDDKGVSNHGGSCISVGIEPERASSLRAMDIDETSTEEGACNNGELHLSVVMEPEKLSSLRDKVVDDEGVCIRGELSSAGEEVVKESGVSEHDEVDKSDVLEQKGLSSAVAMDVDQSSGVCNHDESVGSDVTKLDVVLEDSTKMIVSNHGEFGSSDHSVPEIVISELADESNKNRSREAEVALDEMSGMLNVEDNLAYGVNEGTNSQNNDSGKERMMINKVEALLNDVVAVSSMSEIVIESSLNIGVCNQSESGCGGELKTLADESIERGGSHENESRDAQMGLDEMSNILNAEDNENLLKKTENMGYGENEETNFQNNDCSQEKMMIDEVAALVNDVAALKDNKLACRSVIDTPNKEIFVQTLDSGNRTGTPNKEIFVQPLDSGNRTESGEIEEGEVSDIIKAKVLSTLHLENIGSPGKKLDTEINAVPEHETNIRNLESTDSFAMAVDSNVGGEGKVEVDDTDEEPGLQPNVVGRSQQPRSNNLVFYGDIIEENGTTKQGLDLKKQGDGSGKKKKRGPISEEKKGKKKQKERKRRAEKNRELGVKRLKLQPVVMPKKVVICRHYLNGRCHEGEKCKFSHDAVPLTKSKPCGHFARQCCMKGDDCPFDHDLSKYPCTNYSSKGFCSRGDNCLFSHKMVSKEGEGVGTDTSKQGPKPSSAADDLKPKKQPDPSKKAADNVLKNLGISFKGMVQGTTQSHIGKSQVSSSTSVGRPSPVKSELVNRTAEISLPASQKSDDNVKTQPSVAPKGLNFLSFGRNPEVEGGIIVNKKAETLSSSAEKSTENVKIQPSSAPKGINFLSFGRNSNPYSSSKSSSLLSNSVDENGKSPEPNEVQMASKSPVTNLISPSPSVEGDQSINKLENSSLKSLVLGFSSSGQTSSCFTPLPYKNITNSAQKALSSTLAFAARWEKETTMVKNISSEADESTSSSVSNSKRKTSCGGEDDSAKTLKILDFLASMGRKS